ncbi:MAG TPA: class II fructose-bisphosphatase [Candidatus Acidoferrales bacterium]|nr:class II fructose-bisphosphatase [Candidatus Acidoferrales bacterium]
MEGQLSLEFLRVVEQAAIAAAHTMGQGDAHKSDDAAVKSMRSTMDTVGMDGTIVIGEGERDEAPMLFIGEKVGAAQHDNIRAYPSVDIAVDPLEGTNLCATGQPNSIAVLAASEHGGLLHAPDLYMEKIIVGPSCKGAVDLDAPVADNLRAIAKRLDRDLDDLVVIVLDRPRHKKIIDDIRASGARIRLIGDGDLSAGISAAVRGTGVHCVMGTGGAPEGVLTAAALRCLNGQILARLVVDTPEKAERLAKMGIKDVKRIYDTEELAPGRRIIFAATGVTEGNLLRGVRYFGEGTRTHSLVMTLEHRQVRFIDTVHLEKRPDANVRFV